MTETIKTQPLFKVSLLICIFTGFIYLFMYFFILRDFSLSTACLRLIRNKKKLLKTLERLTSSFTIVINC